MRQKLSFRLLSLLSLLVFAALTVIFVLFVMHNIFIALLLVATILTLVYAAWLIFTGSASHANWGKWLTVVAGAALLAEVVYLLFDRRDRRTVLVLIGLMVIYLALFELLRKRYWAEQRRQGALKGDTAKFSNPYLIINPKAGSGRAAKAHIDDLASRQGIHVIMTKKNMDVADSALEAVHAGADVIGISGGDGSIGAIAKVAIDNNLPIVVLPGGTRCHFARDLGLDPARIADALAGFSGVERRVDVGEINGRIFLNNASFGLYADIVDHPEYREHKVQVARGVLQEIVAGRKRPYDIRFKQGSVAIKRAVQVLVGINRYDTVSLFELGHRRRLDEGVLQVTAVTELNDQLVKHLLVSMSISQLTREGKVPGLLQWVDKIFIVKAPGQNMVVGVDGEREVHNTPVRIRVLPGALRVYVPAEGVRGRSKNPLSFSMVQQMLRAIKS